MPDPETPNEQTAAASQLGTAAPAAFDPSSLSSDALAWLEAEKRKASDAAAASARRAVEAKAKPAPTAPSNAGPPPVGDVHSILALRDAFDDATGDLPIKASQRSLMREAVMRDQPSDMGSYVTRYVDRAGWNTAGLPAPQSAAPTGTAAPSAPAIPSTHRAPPPPTPVVTENTSILSMQPEARVALAQRIGNDEFVKRLMPELVRSRVPFIS